MSNLDDQEAVIIKQFHASIETIMDREKKLKHRFQQLVEVYKQIREEQGFGGDNKDELASGLLIKNNQNLPIDQTQQNQASNATTGGVDNHIQMANIQHNQTKNLKLNAIWQQSLNQNYRIVFEVLQEHLNKINPGFIQTLFNQNSQCNKDILQTLKILYYYFESLDNANIRELMKGVYRISIIHILYCCLDYKNKEKVRIIGFILLFKIISSYDYNQLFRLQEQSLMTLFCYIIDFQSFNEPYSKNSIKDVCVFNSPSSGMPPWTNYIKETAPEKSEKQYLDVTQ